MIVITPPCHKWFHRNSYQKIDIPAQGVWLESVSTLTASGAFGGFLPSLAQKLTPPFPLLLQDKPCWKMSLTALVLWTKVQSCFKGWLVISQVDRATFHFGLQGSWTTCHQREIPHYPCHTQCSGKGHHLSLRLLLLWLDKKLGKVSSQNDEWDYWK